MSDPMGPRRTNILPTPVPEAPLASASWRRATQRIRRDIPLIAFLRRWLQRPRQPSGSILALQRICGHLPLFPLGNQIETVPQQRAHHGARRTRLEAWGCQGVDVEAIAPCPVRGAGDAFHSRAVRSQYQLQHVDAHGDEAARIVDGCP